jgi:DnaJ-class molecular chaperone
LRKAFRKLASKWHPDKNNQSEEQRECADKIFRDINEAYGVLSDPNKRHIYDLGGNPDDPEFMNSQRQSYQPYQPNYMYKYDSNRVNVNEEEKRKSKKKSKKERKSGFDS